MLCDEYHLLLILICLVKSGISLDLGKKNCVGFSIIHKECKQIFGAVAKDRARI